MIIIIHFNYIKHMIGMLCATDREFQTIKENVQNLKQENILGREFYSGKISGKDVVISKCGVGKVSCAITVAAFKLQYKCHTLIFIGTAGSLQKDAKVGDIVVSTGCVQHDFDGRPFVEQCVVFACGKKVIDADKDLIEKCFESAQQYINQNTDEEAKKQFNISNQQVHKGIIVSGDQFISSNEQRQNILKVTPEALCAEMEGAAVAQACYETGMKYCVVRVISDSSDGSAHLDFEKFCNDYAGKVTYGILQKVIQVI